MRLTVQHLALRLKGREKLSTLLGFVVKLLDLWRHRRVGRRRKVPVQPARGEPLPSDDRSDSATDEHDWGGVVVPRQATADTQLGFGEPSELLSEDERLHLDQDIARLHQRRQKAVAKARGIRLS
jgi:DNA-directed RNA polymerase specialized sigma24 family protein